MVITNPGTLPAPPDPALSKLCYDFSCDQPWLEGVEVECDRCKFGATLKSDTVQNALTGLQTAYHFDYKDGSASGWGHGVFVCPCCKKWLFIERELPPRVQ